MRMLLFLLPGYELVAPRSATIAAGLCGTADVFAAAEERRTARRHSGWPRSAREILPESNMAVREI
jgi:hypothetical protein